VKVSELGEFVLIEMLSQIVGASSALYNSTPNLVMGIGDDAAAWKTSQSVQLGTTDILVENIHFDLSQINWHDLGWKSMAVNISDIAAMGGTPKHALISLGLPPDTEVEDVSELYRGIAGIARSLNMTVVGGDITQSPIVIISPTVIGETSKELMMTRSAAKPGDQIAVSGSLGASAAGLKMMNENLRFDDKISAFLRQAHFKANPRVFEGQTLAQNGVKCAIDISDGLVADLSHICQKSKVNARIDLTAILVHPVVKAAFGEDALDLALSGGEDYELLFTAPPKVMQNVTSQLAKATRITVIGEITEGEDGKIDIIDQKGSKVEFKKGGWDHFKNV